MTKDNKAIVDALKSFINEKLAEQDNLNQERFAHLEKENLTLHKAHEKTTTAHVNGIYKHLNLIMGALALILGLVFVAMGAVYNKTHSHTVPVVDYQNNS